jgi:ABC-2 type transport system permease protein
MNASRIFSYTLRHLYLYKRSLPRLMEIFYWPVLDLLVWGFISVYLSTQRGVVPGVIAFFLGALILWDILFRSQQGISVAFLEDVWSRNLLNVFISPITPGEYVAALLAISVMKLAFASTVLTGLAWLLYSFNVFTVGLPLVPLVANLVVMGWSVGIITMSIILRYGQETEVLAWGIAFLFQPVAAVFYPVAVLPEPLKTISHFVPASYVFEGMRQVMAGGAFPMEHIIRAAGLNVIYVALAALYFTLNFRAVKRRGLLAKVGE